VVTVDAEGKVTPVSLGAAVVVSKNTGVKGFTVVKVGQTGSPMPTDEVTTLFNVTRSGIRLDRRTGFFVQQVAITNRQDVPVPGPLVITFEDLPEQVSLVNSTGETAHIVPLGSPTVALPLSEDGLTIQAGASTTLVLEFLNPERHRIGYNLRIYRTYEP